jgi:EAL domain-containing protein (putative c-di-GMP-specific phosphodiesterase class I)/GGDEF domain-containing protein
MRSSRKGGQGWREWSALQSGVTTATSVPLQGDAQVRNRLFPKTRSWFALDAPLALLSPLSVLRIIFAFAAVTWFLAGLVWPLSHPDRATVFVVAATALVAWFAMLRIRRAGNGWSGALTCVWVAEVATLVSTGHGGALSVVATTYFVPIGVFVALFFGVWIVTVCQGAIALSLWITLAGPSGVARGAFLAVVMGAALATASFVVALLMRSTRSLGTLDPDTGLPNGLGVAQRLAQRDIAAPLVVIAVVLRGIDSAQEALGFQAGSELLRRAVEDIGQVLPSDAIIGRTGDELVVVRHMAEGSLSPDEQHADVVPERAVEVARALALTVGRAINAGRYFLNGVEVSLQAHAGLSVAPWDGDAIPELFRRASLSAREAVANGATDAVWHANTHTLTGADLALLADLGMAEERGELRLVFQPQVAASSGEVVSVEALLRWKSRTRGDVSPGIFIPLAERTGLINRITEWVLPEALNTQVRWRQQGLAITTSVNLSPVTMTRQDLAESVLEELRTRSLPPSCLTLEITETAVTNLLHAVLRLTPLREAGIQVSLDDFGSGNTSLSSLPHLPLNELKLDQQFVRRSRESHNDLAIVRTIIELAGRLNLVCVAEGVETEELYADMVAMGFDLLQGYFVAKPLSEDELVQFVRAGPSASIRNAHQSSVPASPLNGPVMREVIQPP